MTTPQTVPDTTLGLTVDEIQLLRRAQIEAGNANPNSTSSRAASRASSAGHLMVDAHSLVALGNYFDRIMRRIAARLDQLTDQSSSAAAQQYDRAGNAIEVADHEIARLNAIMDEIDRLEEDYDKLERLKEVVRNIRTRVEQAERRAEERDRGGGRDGANSGGHRHRQRHAESARTHRR
jgi:TolA-binding protein